MKFTETKLQDVYIIEQDVFIDERGYFLKTFQESKFLELGLDCDFKESYYTSSKKNVIRGMHFQVLPHDHSKLVTIISGKIIDVILDLRKNSKTYKQYISIELSRENRKSIYVPKGCAHGFGVLSSNAIAYYMVTSEHNQKYDKGIHYNSFGQNWGIQNPIVSKRDNEQPYLNNFESTFK